MPTDTEVRDETIRIMKACGWNYWMASEKDRSFYEMHARLGLDAIRRREQARASRSQATGENDVTTSQAEGIVERLRNAPIAVTSAMFDAHILLTDATSLIERQQKEIEALKLDVRTQEALQDSDYKAGVKHGWNLGVDGDDEEFQRCMASTGYVAELKKIREERALLNGGSK